jgi:predicted RNA polymerase sigma factor
VDKATRAIEAVWRIEAPRLIAGLARMVRDIGLAEELAQDALVAALEHWPSDGTPDNPGAWLMATASPIVELNRGVAVSMAEGPAAGLAIVDALRSEPSLAQYHLLPAVRGDLLAKLGRHDEARLEFERAASITQNAWERDFLRTRAAALKNPNT